MIIASLYTPGEKDEPKSADDFNPFYVGREKDRMAHVKPYNPSRLKYFQENA